MSNRIFNAEMLELARGAREMTQAETADAAEITQAMLSKIENKLVQPSDEVAGSLARALRYPTEFFYQVEQAYGFPHFHYRKRSKLNTKPLAKIRAIINIQRQHIAKLYKSWNRQSNKPIPEIDLADGNRNPVEVARMMREYWMLPRGPIESVTEVLEEAGAIVLLCDFGTSHLDAISFRSPGLPPLFFMNRNVPGDRYRFTLAHELGHMVMHSHPSDDGDMESQADEFAANFLMPATDIRPYLAGATMQKLGRVKSFWKVSIAALIRRCRDLKMISEWQYRSMNIEYNKAGYQRGEPFPLAAEKPIAIDRLIAFYLRELRYSVGELAKFLFMEEDDLRATYLPRRPLELVVSN